jgi:hypothetical protein
MWQPERFPLRHAHEKQSLAGTDSFIAVTAFQCLCDASMQQSDGALHAARLKMDLALAHRASDGLDVAAKRRQAA